jgi:tetratricopeptide (TPR) repeat protein
MSVAPQQRKTMVPRGDPEPARKPGRLAGWTSELRGRWQIPLLVIALGGLGVSVWSLRPQEPPKSPAARFEELLGQGVALKEAARYEEASKHVESLLADTASTPAQQVRLHRLMLDIIYAYESGNSVHGPNNCRRLIEHSDRSVLAGESFDAQTHHIRALAREWMGQMAEAVVEYGQALAKGIERPWSVRQHLVQLRRLIGDISPEKLHAELDSFLSSPDVPLDRQFWAAETKMELYAAQNRHDLAGKFLADNLDRFAESRWRMEYDYLRALAASHTGQDQEAERLVRHLRDEVAPGNPLYAQATWLLGTIMQRSGAPEHALSLFEDVLRNTVASPSRAACLLGRAECLAEMERYSESLETFREVIRVATGDPVNAQIDLKAVRESARVWYQSTYQAGRREDALEFLEFAANLAPSADTAVQVSFSEVLAGLHLELGKSAMQETGSRAGSGVDGDRARTHLVAAGQEYLRLAKLSQADPSVAISAIWRAASSFDLAGERSRMVNVLDAFVREYADDTRVPEALLQLGRAYHTGGDLDKAIVNYQRVLTEYPRTPAALASLIPLSDCFHEKDDVDKAEQCLLRIVTPRPGDNLALITPEAPEYQDALFRLGELYTRAEQYEKAIARYEEALQRYAADPRADVATFHLADSYRKSAARLRTDLQDPRNIAFKDTLRATHQERLQLAHEAFENVIGRYQQRPVAGLGDLDRLCLKFSYLYSADCVYDLSLVAGGESAEPFARSLSMYEKAAWLYQRDPIAMTAYVQIVNCYLRMGKVQQAWMALQRARWALRNIPDEQFAQNTPEQGRVFWEQYLTWLEKKPTFASGVVAQAG